ncbi:MAG: AI-2E family transporter [Candidatus Lustribacter sp.]
MNGSLARRLTIGIIVLLALAVAVFVAERIPRTISIFLVAAFIAFGAAPLVQRLERWMPRGAAIAVVYLCLVGALVVLGLVIVPISYAQIVVLVSHTSDYVTASQDAVAHVETFLRGRLGDRVALPTFGQMQTEVGDRVGTMLSLTLASIGAILVSTVNAFLVGASALILSVFFLSRGRAVRGGLLALLPVSRRAKTNALLVEVTSIFGHFVAGQLALCAIVGAAVWALLAPAHFAFALLVAVVCSIGYAVPFFGMIVAQVIAAALAVPQGTAMVIYVTVAIFVIARIADNVLVPKIMGDAVGVSPIGVMFAVFAGGELFGLWGLILGVPAAALVRVLFTYFALPWIVRVQQNDPQAPHPEIVVETPEVTVTVANGV